MHLDFHHTGVGISVAIPYAEVDHHGVAHIRTTKLHIGSPADILPAGRTAIHAHNLHAVQTTVVVTAVVKDIGIHAHDTVIRQRHRRIAQANGYRWCLIQHGHFDRAAVDIVTTAGTYGIVDAIRHGVHTRRKLYQRRCLHVVDKSTRIDDVNSDVVAATAVVSLRYGQPYVAHTGVAPRRSHRDITGTSDDRRRGIRNVDDLRDDLVTYGITEELLNRPDAQPLFCTTHYALIDIRKGRRQIAIRIKGEQGIAIRRGRYPRITPVRRSTWQLVHALKIFTAYSRCIIAERIDKDEHRVQPVGRWHNAVKRHPLQSYSIGTHVRAIAVLVDSVIIAIDDLDDGIDEITILWHNAFVDQY